MVRALPLVLFACAPDYSQTSTKSELGGENADGSGGSELDSGAPSDDGGGSEGGLDSGGGGGETAEPDYSEWDNATLEIITPASGAFLPYHEAADFEAVVYDADGNPTDFGDIEWSSDVDSDWGAMARLFEDDTLDVGLHTITAIARLPNGDRLAYSIGGVLVQAEAAGIYVGDMLVDVETEYDGTPLTTSCVGGATIYVDAYGEVAEGESSCVLSLFGYDTELAHVFELELDEDGSAVGAATVDFGWFDYGFDASGALEDEELVAEWSQEIDVYLTLTVTGSLDVVRVTRDLPTD
jgi:hypothetical protein